LKRLYLDANIYVDFYDLLSSATKKLLPALSALASHVFVTEQIVHEVNRNKLHKAKQACDQLSERLKGNSNVLALLQSLIPTLPKQYRQWGPPPKRAVEKIEELISEKLKNIAESTDEVSVALKPIFDIAVPPTAVELNAARLRKELGNPPGKRSDPLGDQLSWEQLLSNASNGDELWIVTRDTDYYVKALRQCLLHPLLLNDLVNRGLRRTKIHVFDSLAQALQDFNSKAGVRVKNLPRKSVLASAAAEERTRPAREIELRTYLEKGIELLPPHLRVVFVLSDVEGYVPSDIAEMMGMSVDEVARNIQTARLELREILNRTYRRSR
jgi:hypothetical protein